MAIGDINGDLPSAYMRQQLAANQVAAKRASLNDADLTKADPSGPVGRAQRQLPTAGPLSLYQAEPAPGGAPARPVGALPIEQPARGSAPAASLDSINPLPAAQAVPRPASLDGQYRPTGAGTLTGGAGGQVVARQGADGTAEFSNHAADQKAAQGLGQIIAQGRTAEGAQPMTLESLPAVRGVNAQGSDQPASLASLGSAANLGDGLGTFSQADAGDSALASSRFARAAQIREDGANKDRLQRAVGRQSLADSIGVVRDSSKPLTMAEQQQMGIDQQAREARLENIGVAQDLIGHTQQGRQGDISLSRAAGLEALRARAADPSATADDQENYLRASDPAGYLKARQVAGSTALKNQKEQLEIDKLQAESKQKQEDRTIQKTGSLDIARRARDLAQSIGKDEFFKSITGTYDSMTPTLLGDSKDLINRANQLQTLLTADNLKLMTGVLTDKDISFLTQIGSGLNVGSKGIDGSEEGTRKVLDEIVGRLDQKIGDYEKSIPGKLPSASADQSESRESTEAVQVTNDQDYAALPSGSQFFDPQGNLRRKP